MKKNWLLTFKPIFIFSCVLSFIFALNIEKNNQSRLPASLSSRVTPLFFYNFKSNDFIINVLREKVLTKIENSGYSINEVLEENSIIESNLELFQNNKLYRDIVINVGESDVVDKEDQLPANIKNLKGDIPEMVYGLRGIEDKGKRTNADPMGAYKIRQVSSNASNPYLVEKEGDEPRHFDQRWLKSKYGRISLIGIVNRIDKKDFNISEESCGEVRFIYRLGYQIGNVGSTLPFFINVVYDYPYSKDCSEFAQMWRGNETIVDENSLSAYLLRKDGPLDKSIIRFKQVEINYQSLRFTSTYMMDFGGQAMYFLRIFKKHLDGLTPTFLENTPDVLKVEKDPKLVATFLNYISQKENLKQLDQGTLVIPNFSDNFLSKKAISYTTLGRARMANKPYSKILKNKMQELNNAITPDMYKNLKYIKSPEALVERLNNLTCMGCHQSGGTAGFHLLGFANEKSSHHFNRQELPISAHSYKDIERRKAYLEAMVNQVPINKFRPHSNFSNAKWPMLKSDEDYALPQFESLKVRDLCVINGNHFSSQPSCETSGTPFYKIGCSQTVSNKNMGVLFGECVVYKEGESNRLFAGHVCRKGEMEEADISSYKTEDYNFYSFMDKFKQSKDDVYLNFGKYDCGLPRGGTPLGRLSRRCSLAEEHFDKFDALTVDGKDFSQSNLAANFIPAEICANRGGDGFDNCAASTNTGSCLEKIIRRDMLDTCYPGHFCREDFICQKIPDYQSISNQYYQRRDSNGSKYNLGNSQKINLIGLKSLREINNIGFCTPNYFLFNMRVDGHPDPIKGKTKPLEYNDNALLRGYSY